jgi:hypothetical protein
LAQLSSVRFPNNSPPPTRGGCYFRPFSFGSLFLFLHLVRPGLQSPIRASMSVSKPILCLLEAPHALLEAWRGWPLNHFREASGPFSALGNDLRARTNALLVKT